MQTQDSTHEAVREAQMLALKATRRCPCISQGEPVCFACAPTPDAAHVIHGPNCICEGSDRIPILDPPTPESPLGKHGLRVPCTWPCGQQEKGRITYAFPVEHRIHQRCKGLGYTLNKSFWPWLEAAISDLGEDLQIDISNELVFYTRIAEAVASLVKEGE